MKEFYPIKKERLDTSFFKHYVYILFLGIFILLGTSYGLTFFTRNTRIGTINFTMSEISISASGDTNISSLTKLSNNEGIQEGLIYNVPIEMDYL